MSNIYKPEFLSALDYCKNNNLFLGFGNPNGKVLVIGKEHYCAHNYPVGTDEFCNEILDIRTSDNKKNVLGWEANVQRQFVPDFANTAFNNDSNPQIAWMSQNNKLNITLKDGSPNWGTSGTYLNYQKIYQNLFLNGQKQEKINFQKEFFLSEMNDLPSKESYNLPRLNELRKSFINERKSLFKLDFFRTFPIVIIASGHYAKNHGFDIEEVFDVKFTGETKFISKSWYNVHYSEDKKRIVLHTRQLSNAVEGALLDAVNSEIQHLV